MIAKGFQISVNKGATELEEKVDGLSYEDAAALVAVGLVVGIIGAQSGKGLKSLLDTPEKFNWKLFKGKYKKENKVEICEFTDNAFEKHPSTPVGHKKKEISILPGSNAKAIIDGIEFSGHALDRMQERGLTPSMIKHVMKNGEILEGNKPGIFVFNDKQNNVKVITNGNKKVVTVVFGGIK